MVFLQIQRLRSTSILISNFQSKDLRRQPPYHGPKEAEGDAFSNSFVGSLVRHFALLFHVISFLPIFTYLVKHVVEDIGI